jgi:hypothetical protein
MKRVFLSFRVENKKQVDGIRLMAWNDDFDLEFYDESVRTPFDSENSTYIRSQIKPKITRASAAVCFLDSNTHTSAWVDWEMRTALELNKTIILMGLPGVSGNLVVPPSVRETPWFLWDPDLLTTKIEAAP